MTRVKYCSTKGHFLPAVHCLNMLYVLLTFWHSRICRGCLKVRKTATAKQDGRPKVYSLFLLYNCLVNRIENFMQENQPYLWQHCQLTGKWAQPPQRSLESSCSDEPMQVTTVSLILKSEVVRVSMGWKWVPFKTRGLGDPSKEIRNGH